MSKLFSMGILCAVTAAVAAVSLQDQPLRLEAGRPMTVATR
jgi:hypothetical protein